MYKLLLALIISIISTTVYAERSVICFNATYTLDGQTSIYSSPADKIYLLYVRNDYTIIDGDNVLKPETNDSLFMYRFTHNMIGGVIIEHMKKFIIGDRTNFTIILSELGSKNTTVGMKCFDNPFK